MPSSRGCGASTRSIISTCRPRPNGSGLRSGSISVGTAYDINGMKRWLRCCSKRGRVRGSRDPENEGVWEDDASCRDCRNVAARGQRGRGTTGSGQAGADLYEGQRQETLPRWPRWSRAKSPMIRPPWIPRLRSSPTPPANCRRCSRRQQGAEGGRRLQRFAKGLGRQGRLQRAHRELQQGRDRRQGVNQGPRHAEGFVSGHRQAVWRLHETFRVKNG